MQGEPLKLGIKVGQTTVAEYLANADGRHRRAERASSRITPLVQRQWISSSFPRSGSECCMCDLSRDVTRHQITASSPTIA